MKWGRRGYSDADLVSAQKKLESNIRPGAITYLTTRELRAASADLMRRADDFIIGQYLKAMG